MLNDKAQANTAAQNSDNNLAAPGASKQVDELTIMRSLKHTLDKLPSEAKGRVITWLQGQVEAERQAVFAKSGGIYGRSRHSEAEGFQ
jgi:hypothetical protein